MNNSDNLNIAVTFPSASGELIPSQFGSHISSQNTQDLVPDTRAVSIALEELDRRGFMVTKLGKLTASIRGRQALFESCFGTELSEVTFSDDGFTRNRSANSLLYPAENAPWNPDPALYDLFDEAYIQWPYIYLNERFSPDKPSPIAPQVNYHHLRVPGDLISILNVAQVHRQGVSGKGIKVAMIDSGFAHRHHPYFEEMGYSTSCILAPGAIDISSDGNGHGTGESANLLAVAPNCTFIGIKLNNETNPSLSASIHEGFLTALEHNPQIISVSLGFDLRGISNLPGNLVALEEEIAQAVADGIVVVFSAGNGHVAFPAMMPDVIAVGGVYVAENGKMVASDYASAFMSKIYPGRRVPDFCGLVGLESNNANYIMLPIPQNCLIDQRNSIHDGTSLGDGWGVFSGTSASAPQIAGVCALLLESNPNLTPSEIKGILRRSSRDVILGVASAASNESTTGLSASIGTDSATGSGLIDAFEAWKQV